MNSSSGVVRSSLKLNLEWSIFAGVSN